MTCPGATTAHGLSVQRDGQRHVARALPEEVPVALTLNGSTHAVMMATPADLEDFAIGFALTEQIVATQGQVDTLEIVTFDEGIEARLWLPEPLADAVAARRRAMAGPVGCGLCGIESLAEASRALPRVDAPLRLSSDEIASACDALRDHQPLHDRTHAVHAAGFLQPGRGIILVREDVGRHNALDKLIGALARQGIDPAGGAVVLTSRVSTEMVQKSAIAGIPAIIAVSAPTAQALRLAETAGMTVAAFARRGGYDVYSHAGRIGPARQAARATPDRARR